MTIKRNPKQSVNMRLHILDTARRLMIEKGIKETSLKDISKAADISTGTLYYHYSAKEDIIYDIAYGNLQQITDGLLAWIDDVSADASPEQMLNEVFEKILGAETRGRLHLYLLSSAETTSRSLADKFRERYEDWRKTLELGMNKVLDQSPEQNRVLSFLIISVLDCLIIQKMLGAEDIPVEEIVRTILSTI